MSTSRPQVGDSIEVVREGDHRHGQRGTIVSGEEQGAFVRFNDSSGDSSTVAVAVEGFRWDSIKLVAASSSSSSSSPSSRPAEPATAPAGTKHQKPSAESPVPVPIATPGPQEQRVEPEKDLFDRSSARPASASGGRALEYAKSPAAPPATPPPAAPAPATPPAAPATPASAPATPASTPWNKKLELDAATKAAFEQSITDVIRDQPKEPLRAIAQMLMQHAVAPPEDDFGSMSAEQLLDGLHAEPKVRTCLGGPIIGTKNDRSLDFYGGAFGRDGKLYLIPRRAGRVVCWDPATGDSKTIGDQFVEFDGSKTGTGLSEAVAQQIAESKWIGAALAPDGCIYALPGKCKRVLRICPSDQTAAEFGDDLTPLFDGNEFPWHETVVGNDGKIYGVPLQAQNVLVFDPSTGRAEVFGEGTLKKGGNKFISGILSPNDGCIYCPPHADSRVLKIDPKQQKVTYIGEKFQNTGGNLWHSGAVGADGCIYCIPGEGTHVLRIVPTKDEAAVMNHEPLPGGWAWHRGFAGSDGCVYGVAHANKEGYRQLLRVDPANGTVRMVGEETPLGLSKAEEEKPPLRIRPYGAAIAPCGAVYIIPTFTPYTPLRVHLAPTGKLLAQLVDAHAGKLRKALASDAEQRSLIMRSVVALSCGNDADVEIARRCLEVCGQEVTAIMQDTHFGQLLLRACMNACKMPPQLGPNVAHVARQIGIHRVMRLELHSHPGKGVVLKGGETQHGQERAFRIAIGPSSEAVTVILLEDGRLLLAHNPSGCTLHDKPYGLDLWGGRRALGQKMHMSTFVNESSTPHKWAFGSDMTLTNTAGKHDRGERGLAEGLTVVGATGNLSDIEAIQLVASDDASFQQINAQGGGLKGDIDAHGPDQRLVFEKKELQGVTPPLALLRSLVGDTKSMARCLTTGSMRATFVRLVCQVLNLDDETANPTASAEERERLDVSGIVRQRMPKLAETYDRLVFSPLSHHSTHIFLEGVALFALYTSSDMEWNPAPETLEGWLRPARQPPATGLVKASTAVEHEGGAALDAVWPMVAPLAVRVIARIVKAVDANEVSQKILHDFYTQEKEGSLENYRAALLRCRREPTYREYVATSSKLKRELKDRVCKQQQRSFPKLLQNAAERQEQFVTFVKLLAERTRAEASLPPAKATRHGEYHCLKGAWRTIEKMALKPGALPEDYDVSRMEDDALCELLDASFIFDVLRGSLKCSDFNVIVTVLDLLLDLDEVHQKPSKVGGFDLERYSIKLHRIKCRFTQPTSGGWADLLVNFSFTNDPNKHVCELQLQHEMLLVIRKEGGAHEAYSSFRSAFEVLEAIGRAPNDTFNEELTQEEMNPVDWLLDEVHQLRKDKAELRQQNTALEQRLAALEKRMGA